MMSSTLETIAERYQVTGRLGSGGMGEVYRAQDSVLNRTVALKVLPVELARQPGFITRFRREAQSVARVNHPNVVQVYDWGESEDTYYMVMEYVRGKNLRQILAENGSLAPRQACEVISQVLGALAAAHDQGLVHRDVKPENVLVSTDGAVKVTDFGIARAAEGTAFTSSMLGTVAYAAPEQARGEAVGPRTDLYSVGCLFYELLTGSMPFEGDAARILHLHLTERVPVPSAAAPQAGTDADYIVSTATNPDPERRYSSALEMRIEVIAALSLLPPAASLAELTHEITSPVPADAIDTLVPVSEPRKKRRWLKMAAALVLLLSIAGAVFALSPVKVPRVAGLTQVAAKRQIEDAGLRANSKREFSDKLPDTVLRTIPPAGTRVKRGGGVIVVLSKGPELTDVPNLVGLQVEEAKLLIGSSGLTVGAIELRNSRDPVGAVLEQDPKPGRRRKGDPVNLVVSSGPRVFGVPDTFGKTQAEAEALINGAGFVVKVETVFSDATEGTVYDQTPKAGTQAEEGSAVKIFVSKGPEPFDVPNVIGKKCAEAKSQLEGRGLVVVVKDVDGNPISCSTNTVLDQAPRSPTKVRKGQEVILYVAK